MACDLCRCIACSPSHEKPTFDEWHRAKHGVSFEQLHMPPGGRIEDTMRALTYLVREYVSEMVR